MIKRKYTKEDFTKVRQFLIDAHGDYDVSCNWNIERLNFAFSVASHMHDGLDFMYDTIMLWEKDNNLMSMVINEGEMEGEVFFLFRKGVMTEDLLSEMFEYAESTSYAMNDQQKYIRLMIPEPLTMMSNMALSRGYNQSDWEDHQTVVFDNIKVTKELPEGFEFATGLEVSPKKVAIARSLTWGYDQNRELVRKSITSTELMRTMPDYDSYTDMYILSPEGDVAAFACLWFDPINKLGLLEPLGTVPKYRRMGLASIVLYEANRRVMEKGAVKCYGADQKFYYDIGYESEVAWVPFEKSYD